jgi:hypothetical protein
VATKGSCSVAIAAFPRLIFLLTSTEYVRASDGKVTFLGPGPIRLPPIGFCRQHFRSNHHQQVSC